MKSLTVVLFLTVIVGCATKPPTPESRANWPMLEIISEPPGARIEIGGDYIGDAPITIPFKRGRTSFGYSELIISASPNIAGMYTQSKYYGMQDRTPSRVFFDMSLAPVGKTSKTVDFYYHPKPRDQ